ncbi:hypothetical protein K7957_09125 [Sphingomonas yunnanensis]|uniref:hypothetical protein n=1 Tax=Sphingomonas yunnanensis TaxID=310400 RepID=UPI001CA77F5A|nr:hypothetical protein [Sphingomonas yunnanensis]MBY9063093.1 hypothetical protein [Sphingomonas yunnanensis]
MAEDRAIRRDLSVLGATMQDDRGSTGRTRVDDMSGLTRGRLAIADAPSISGRGSEA